MKSSPIYTKYHTDDYIGYDFDPRLHFSQFLKEARTQACDEEAPPNLNESGKKQMDDHEKKSWRTSLFSWLKADKKSKPCLERCNNNNSYISKPIRSRYVSGPIHPANGAATARPRRPMSGPLNALFNSTKKMEMEMEMEDDKINHTKKIPYICLNNPPPPPLRSYGPVYMVT